MAETINNLAHRMRVLRKIVKRADILDESEEVRKELQQALASLTVTQVAAMELELVAEGIPIETIRRLFELQAESAEEAPQADSDDSDLPPGHPVDTFRHENEAIRSVLAEMRLLAKQIRGEESGEDLASLISTYRSISARLAQIDKHYKRKEVLLFSRLEKYGIAGSARILWVKDDEVRQLLTIVDRRLSEARQSMDSLREILDIAGEAVLTEIEEMIFQEESILLPMAMETLSADDWEEIWQFSDEIGYCLVEPRIGYQPTIPADPPATAEVAAGEGLPFFSGTLTLEQLQAILPTMPVDLTFVDADDRVQYFTESRYRIFDRSRAVLGRKVENCHPPKSVHYVRQILADFRSGKEHAAGFWTEIDDRFIHIRYYAVRSPEGKYLGTLEFAQDLTPLRALSGENRELTYEPPVENP